MMSYKIKTYKKREWWKAMCSLAIVIHNDFVFIILGSKYSWSSAVLVYALKKRIFYDYCVGIMLQMKS